MYKVKGRMGVLSLIGIIHALYRLEEEPCATFALVDEVFQDAGCCDIVVVHAYLVGGALHLRHMFVILHQSPGHFTCLHKITIVILDGLQLTDMADAADSGAPDAPHTLGQY